MSGNDFDFTWDGHLPNKILILICSHWIPLGLLLISEAGLWCLSKCFCDIVLALNHVKFNSDLNSFFDLDFAVHVSFRIHLNSWWCLLIGLHIIHCWPICWMMEVIGSKGAEWVCFLLENNAGYSRGEGPTSDLELVRKAHGWWHHSQIVDRTTWKHPNMPCYEAIPQICSFFIFQEVETL